MVSSYQEYEDHLDKIGDAILTWADADKDFRGATEVRKNVYEITNMNVQSKLIFFPIF